MLGREAEAEKLLQYAVTQPMSDQAQLEHAQLMYTTLLLNKIFLLASTNRYHMSCWSITVIHS